MILIHKKRKIEINQITRLRQFSAKSGNFVSDMDIARKYGKKTVDELIRSMNDQVVGAAFAQRVLKAFSAKSPEFVQILETIHYYAEGK
jgi:hypothetical protein